MQTRLRRSKRAHEIKSERGKMIKSERRRKERIAKERERKYEKEQKRESDRLRERRTEQENNIQDKMDLNFIRQKGVSALLHPKHCYCVITNHLKTKSFCLKTVII